MNTNESELAKKVNKQTCLKMRIEGASIEVEKNTPEYAALNIASLYGLVENEEKGKKTKYYATSDGFCRGEKALKEMI